MFKVVSNHSLFQMGSPPGPGWGSAAASGGQSPETRHSCGCAATRVGAPPRGRSGPGPALSGVPCRRPPPRASVTWCVHVVDRASWMPSGAGKVSISHVPSPLLSRQLSRCCHLLLSSLLLSAGWDRRGNARTFFAAVSCLFHFRETNCASFFLCSSFRVRTLISRRRWALCSSKPCPSTAGAWATGTPFREKNSLSGRVQRNPVPDRAGLQPATARR